MNRHGNPAFYMNTHDDVSRFVYPVCALVKIVVDHISRPGYKHSAEHQKQEMESGKL